MLQKKLVLQDGQSSTSPVTSSPLSLNLGQKAERTANRGADLVIINSAKEQVQYVCPYL